MVSVVYGNVFAADRLELIAGLMPGAQVEELLRDEQALARVIEPRVEPFLRAGGLHAPGLNEADRLLLRTTFLYLCYIRSLPHFDALIERQAGKTGEPIVVGFADEVIGDLVSCGFEEDIALRYFALYYQLRRGYSFIRAGLAGRSTSMRRWRVPG